jgi:AAA family ATP:ADP antiporter
MNNSSENRAQTLYPALALGLMTAAFIISKTGRDALFFQGKGIFRLPVATMMITAASLPLAILFVKAMKIWGARPARLGLLLFAGAALSLAAPFLEAGDSPLLFNIFIFIPSAFGIMFASLWLLAADIFETTAKPQAARAFSRIGASSLAGGMLGGFVAKGLSPLIEAKWLILVGALMIFLVAALVALTHRRFPSNIVAKKDREKKSSWFAPLANSYARILLAISMLGALAGILIDVQFYISATSASMGSKGNANFFANFYIMLNFSSLLLQLFVTPKIQDKIGIGGGLMVLPLALVGGVGFASAAATAFSLSALRVTEGGLRSSIHRSIWEQAFIPIEPGERSTVKLAVDGIAARIAEGIAAVTLYIWLQQVAPGGVVTEPLDTRWMIWLTCVTVVAWVAIAQKFRRRAAPEQSRVPTLSIAETDCARFPDQCSCTTELGKGIA